MKILLLSNLDWPGFQCLDQLLPSLRQHDVCIFLTRRVGANHSVQPALEALARRGQQALLESLKLTAPTTADVSEPMMISAMSARFNRPVLPVTSLNHGQGQKAAQNFAPDLIISVRFGSILKSPAIELPRYGVLNLHSGLLPEYRGIMATFWAMIHQDAYYGFTLHQITDAGIDTGPIIYRQAIALNLQLDYSSLLDDLYRQAIPKLVRAIERIETEGALEAHPTTEPGHYYSQPERGDIALFEQLGLRWWP